MLMFIHFVAVKPMLRTMEININKLFCLLHYEV